MRFSFLNGGRSREQIFAVDLGTRTTKAVLLDSSREVLAGFYTRTSGRPLIATQAIFEAAIEVGADDVTEQDEQIEVTTEPSSFIEVREALEAKGFKQANAEITMIPQTQVVLDGKQAESMLRLMDKLEDNDDVQNVYANFDITAEEMEKMM